MSYCRNRLSEPTSSSDGQRLVGARQEEAGDVVAVDRLDQQADAGLLQLAQPRSAGWRPAWHARASRATPAGNLPARQLTCGQPQRVGVADGLRHAFAELAHAVRMAGDAALAGFPVAGRQVVQHLLAGRWSRSAAASSSLVDRRRGTGTRRRRSRPSRRPRSGPGMAAR